MCCIDINYFNGHIWLSINEAVTELRKGLSNNKVQWRDKETGQIITSTSSSTRRALTKQLDQAIERQTEVNAKVDELNEKIFNFETEIVEARIGDGSTSELGPLKYLSGLTGLPMDRIINYLLLTIIFVFDPLAIALVIAANFAFARLRKPTRENIYGEKIPLNEDWDKAEERMNIIGQNGNEGLHYEDKVEEVHEEGKAKSVKATTQDSSSTKSSIKEKIDNLKSKLSTIKKTKKLGPNGKKSIQFQIDKLEQQKKDDEDLTITY